jgi:hypothetical protein
MTAKKYRKVIREHYNKQDIASIMAASIHFGSGFGIKKMKPIVDLIPDIMTTTISDTEIIEKITSINGMSKKTGEKFINGLHSFKEFYHSLP